MLHSLFFPAQPLRAVRPSWLAAHQIKAVFATWMFFHGWLGNKMEMKHNSRNAIKSTLFCFVLLF